MSKDLDSCTGCPLDNGVARRAFLRSAAGHALAAAGIVAFASRDLAALPAGFVHALGSGPEKVYPLPTADGVFVDRAESVIIARFDDRVYAFSLACPHQNTAIRWQEHANRFQCPKHKSRYRPDGTFIEGRATRGLDRFAVRREGDRLHVNFDALYREDDHAAQWAAAVVHLGEK